MSTPENVVTVPAHVEEMAARLRAGTKVVTVDTNGKPTLTQDAYERTLEGTDLTMDLLKKAYDHTLTATAALGLVFGEESEAAMAANKELDRTTVTIPVVGRDNIQFVYDRTATSINPKTKEPTVSHGRLHASYTVYGARNRGAFAEVRKHLASRADALLK